MEVGGGVRGTFSDVEPLVASHQLVGVTMKWTDDVGRWRRQGMGGRQTGKWAREELNLRPHAYQAAPRASRSRHYTVFPRQTA